jgi:hypothetical protein
VAFKAGLTLHERPPVFDIYFQFCTVSSVICYVASFFYAYTQDQKVDQDPLFKIFFCQYRNFIIQILVGGLGRGRGYLYININVSQLYILLEWSGA